MVLKEKEISNLSLSSFMKVQIISSSTKLVLYYPFFKPVQYATILQDGSQIQSGFAMLIAYVDTYWYSGTYRVEGMRMKSKMKENYLCSYPVILVNHCMR